MKKRVVCAFLGLVMMVSQSFTVFADTESDIRQQKAQAESQLSQTNDTLLLCLNSSSRSSRKLMLWMQIW